MFGEESILGEENVLAEKRPSNVDSVPKKIKNDEDKENQGPLVPDESGGVRWTRWAYLTVI